MTRDRFLFVFLLVLLLPLLGVWGCGGGPAPEGILEDEHDDREEKGTIQLDGSALEKLGIELAEAGPGALEIAIELPGEVQVNGDRMAHVAPRVGGVVREVHVSLGDNVRGGQLMAILESRELADSKAAFLAAAERMSLATATFDREERLWKKKISSEQDYLDARKSRAEARIEMRAVEQKLHALGVPQSLLDQLHEQHDATFTEYNLTSPFGGTVIDRHITIGETVSAGSPVFTVADLETVWIDLSVYQKHIGSVRSGQTARVGTPHGDEIELMIDFVQPLVGEDTRTAMARIIAPNPDGVWHPGCFVNAKVTTSQAAARVVVPVSAVIRMEDGVDVVFVETAEGFEPRPVALGRRSRDNAEIVTGLDPGDRYVAKGGFSLKAELGKDAFGEDDD